MGGCGRLTSLKGEMSHRGILGEEETTFPTEIWSNEVLEHRLQKTLFSERTDHFKGTQRSEPVSAGRT